MLRRLVAAPLVAIPLGIAAPPVRAQPTPAQSTPTQSALAPTTPTAVREALLAYGLVVADVRYEASGTDGRVAVTLFGPAHLEMPDQIFAVAWASEPYRFSDVVVRWPGGEIRRTYAELATQLGPRRPGLDQSTVMLALLFAGGDWSLGFEELIRFIGALVLAVCIAVTLLVVVFTMTVGIALRARRARVRSG